MRRNAKEERTLFHYNGHGVPKPTDNGEIWVFNKDYTQYIPLSIYDLQQWLQSPTIYVFDSNSAGLIVKWFNKFVEQRQGEREKIQKLGSTNVPEDHILLASCSSNETLPTNPNLPADVFTSCLTTPIKMALKWFVSQTILSEITLDLIDQIPGRLNDRRTFLGELNWIFTAVTDTIAWNVLPKPLFQKLFRQDLLVACLFRNFLLAERILRSCRCTPISYPKLPQTFNHPMWQAWDLVADYCLAQLPKLILNPNMEFKHSSFFTEQLTAFEVWLEFGTEDKEPPEQLPIVLQVLLSQQHRLRALELLGKFLDLGPWAVNQGLSVGIFPYVLKLLQSPASELKEILVFIWAKILAVDKSCRLDLLRENGQNYFISILSSPKIPASLRTNIAFVLSILFQNDENSTIVLQGRQTCLNAKLIQICLAQINDVDQSVRLWITLCLAEFWKDYEEAKQVAIKEQAHEKICTLLTDPFPEVRAAAVYALGTFISTRDTTIQPDTSRSSIEFNLGLTLPIVTSDASPLARRELAISLSYLVRTYLDNFVEEVKRQLRNEYAQNYRKKIKLNEKSTPTPKNLKLNQSSSSILMPSINTSNPPSIASSPSISTISPTGASEAALLMASLAGNFDDPNQEQPTVYDFIWKLIRSLAIDPISSVSKIANTVLHYVRNISQQQHYNTLINSGQENAVKIIKETNSSERNKSPESSRTLKSSHSSSNLSSANHLTEPTTPKKLQQSSRMSGISGLLQGKKNKESTTPLNLASPIAENPNASSITDDLGDIQNEMEQTKMAFLKIESDFYSWACLKFSSPIMRANEEDETAPDYSERRWRQQRHEHLVKEANSQLLNKSTNLIAKKLDHEVAILEINCQLISSIIFHPFESIVVISDESKNISIWNWEEGVQINQIDNKSPPNSRISSLEFLNEHDNILIAVGSGMI